jgi:hypothetical protein
MHLRRSRAIKVELREPKAMTLEQFYQICDSIIPNENGCHNWPKSHGWYQKIWSDGTRGTHYQYAHRLALERKLGRSIKEGFESIHSCDNKSCVNPDHLDEGTHYDNMRDRDERNPSGNYKSLSRHWYTKRFLPKNKPNNPEPAA